MTGLVLRLLRRTLAVGALALALLPAAPAAAAVPRSFFGIQVANGLGHVPEFTDGDLSRFSEDRIGTVRMHFDWSAVEPTAGTPRDWTAYDEAVSELAQSGTRILGLLVGSPSFASRRATDPPRTKDGLARWRVWVWDVVQRYGNGGSFWREHPEVPYLPVATWEVWNEPNYPRFWFERPNARQYAKFLARTSPIIRLADPRARIAIGGLPNVTSATGHIHARMEEYLAALYRSSRRMPRYFDVVAIHPYAVDHRGVLEAIRRTRQVMNHFHDRRTPIWITEFGWATYHGNFTATSSGGQARQLTQSFRALIRVRHRYRLLGLIWYAWRDALSDGRGDWWGLHCGLFTVDDQPKPAWAAFARFSRSSR